MRMRRASTTGRVLGDNVCRKGVGRTRLGSNGSSRAVPSRGADAGARARGVPEREDGGGGAGRLGGCVAAAVQEGVADEQKIDGFAAHRLRVQRPAEFGESISGPTLHLAEIRFASICFHHKLEFGFGCSILGRFNF